jgi:hypothetical protein
MATKKIKPLRFEIKILNEGTDEQTSALLRALESAGFGAGWPEGTEEGTTNCEYTYCGGLKSALEADHTRTQRRVSDAIGRSGDT